MKVILLKDVRKIGKRYEVKEVADGFARNLLIPRGLAKIASDEALEWLEDVKTDEKAAAKDELEKIGDLANHIDGIEVEIPVKIGEQEQLFEKVTGAKISKKMQDMGYNIQKNQIVLEAPIEELGEYNLKVRFEHNLESDIKVRIIEDKI